MEKEQSWRSILAALPTAEKRRIVEVLGIQGRTLDRWVKRGTLLPRVDKMRQLISILPTSVRARFVASLQQDPLFKRYKDTISIVSTHLEIPSTFYARVLETNISVTGKLRFAAVSQQILLQALGLFDPHYFGFSLTVLRCTRSPSGKPVRSLYQQCSMGTPPWSTIMNQAHYFHGSESLAGQAVTQLRPITLSDYQDGYISLPAPEDTYAASMAACPIIRDGRVAGALLAASAQPFFFLPGRLNLLRQYCYLIVVGIDDKEFYEPQHLELCSMPPISMQQDINARLQEKHMGRVRRNPLEEQFKTWPEVERELLYQIEGELLELTTPSWLKNISDL